MVFSIDQIYFIVWLLISVISSYVYKILPRDRKFQYMKHLFSVVWAWIMSYSMFGKSSFFIGLFPVILVWIIGKSTIKSDLKKKTYVVFGVWIFTLSYLSLYHINRMRVYWLVPVIDSASSQMMITMKLTDFITQRYIYIKKNISREYPSFIEWLGFIYFIPSVLAGPILSFDEYKDYIDSFEHDDLHLHDNNKSISKQLQVLAVKFMLFFFLTVFGIFYMPIGYLTTSDFAERSFLSKIILFYLITTLVRFKFYATWTITEISYIVSGASSFHKFAGRNVDILSIEFPKNTYDVLNGWNKRTNDWLKNCVYNPLKNAGVNGTYCILVTNIVSAVWHGFYPGYYLTFFMGGLCTILGRIWRKNISSRIYMLKMQSVDKVYNTLKTIGMMLIVSFTSLPFQYYSLSSTITVFNNIYWYGLFMILSGWIIVFTLPRLLKSYEMFNKVKDKDE